MSGVLICAAPPRTIKQGGKEYTETCARRARLWRVSKGAGQSTEVLRCDEHAAQLRSRGYTVELVREAPQAAKKKWDMTTTHSLDAATEWLRKQSGALMVLVVRIDDVALAMDAGLGVGDFFKHLEAAGQQLGAAFERGKQQEGA